MSHPLSESQGLHFHLYTCARLSSLPELLSLILSPHLNQDFQEEPQGLRAWLPPVSSILLMSLLGPHHCPENAFSSAHGESLSASPSQKTPVGVLILKVTKCAVGESLLALSFGLEL